MSQNATSGPCADLSMKSTDRSLPCIAHVLCGWPLLLIAIGGALGGGLGGAAYGINLSIYKSNLSVPAKVISILAVGLGAAGLWFAGALAFLSIWGR